MSYIRKVGKNNRTSGKVTLPVSLIGKKVEIKIIENENGKNERL